MGRVRENIRFNQIELAVFAGRLDAICEEMGYVLKRSALSPNIKDRLDFSCAFFDKNGRICAQAAHIPVHLGSMAYAMKDLVSDMQWHQDDVLILNDPFLGGTHLPDVTVISPVFIEGHLEGFFANRAHHANIGSTSPGSMPISSSIDEEGVLISPCKLYEKGELNQSVVSLISKIEGKADVDSSTQQIPGDFLAQVSANKAGLERLKDWMSNLSSPRAYLSAGVQEVNRYGSELASFYFKQLPEQSVEFEDVLDSDGFGAEAIPIRLRLSINEGGRIVVDFTGSSDQVKGNLNCPMSVTAASVYYVFICLLPAYAPQCQGVFDSIEIKAPDASLVNAHRGCAVAAGNVETSMRIVDVVIGALNRLGVDVSAASQGTMNNVALGGLGNRRWDYYETIGGGMGASSQGEGLSAVQCHLTNTLNTPVESLEMHYPMRIKEYAIRENSGGEGKLNGGNGIVRSYEFLEDTSVTLLTERRKFFPWGAEGGGDGAQGINLLNGKQLEPKDRVYGAYGDVLTICTPGGGAWGKKP